MSTGATIYGLLIAAIGFVLTRFTVTLAASDTTVAFLFAGIVPLVLGLSLTAFGVILAVGAYDVAFVRTTALWCVLGTGTMLLLVVLTLLGSEPDVFMNVEAARERTYLSNFLIGGATGGTLTGMYAAQNSRQRRELRQQANRLILLNRLLRDQVINSATAIKGHLDILQTGESDTDTDVIGDQADAVIETIENVKYLAETADRSDLSLGAIDVCKTVESELDEIREQYPHASVSVSGVDETVRARANAQLSEIVSHLVENAIEYSDSEEPTVSVSVEATTRAATIRVTDDGPGLPASQQRLLEAGEIAEFDDPTTGFGLNIVRLLVESFDGAVETRVTDAGTSIEVILPRTRGADLRSPGTTVTAPGVVPSRLALAVGSSLVAGLLMGAGMVALGGDVPVIGALYGVENLSVALISHEFHSVVFGLIFAALLSALPTRYSGRLSRTVGLGVGFGLLLWLVAAGLVMPVWLQFLGIPAPVPNLTVAGLGGHLVWGSSLGLLYHVGDAWLDRVDLPKRLFELPTFSRT
jgi:two-component system OmpR family sensor kinase